ncbi:glycosyltransferase family 4 protein [Halosolutus gelatinilyticus]|uniref:glycosyltransferase family 4 protein n=1 Tax=Halosolutus gelatinilyticus TaxID=2931975 RepID=UPI001FF42606|nr:glycosyltransferase family 4 protein [Halosolutus gelatinilyticus]
MDAVHLTTAHDPVDTRIFDKEATSLLEAGFSVGIMAHNPPQRAQNGVTFYDLGTTSSRLDRWQSISQVARRAKEIDASIYHFHDPELIPVGVYLSSVTDSAVIYDVHEDFGHIVTIRPWIPKPLELPLSHGIPRFEQIAAKWFDGVVAVSQGIAAPFSDTDTRVIVAHNFPKTKSLPTINDPIERKAEHVLCYVGGLEQDRGIYRMITLLNTLVNRGMDVELWLLGSWSPAVDQVRVRRHIRHFDLESHIRFPGHLTYSEMFQYLYSADVGLALLDTEHYRNGVPTKLFEYLYAGLPIVATPIEAVDQYIPDEYCYTVSQEDTVAAADAVEEAVRSDFDVTAMQSLVEDKYSWEAEAESLVALYEELL